MKSSADLSLKCALLGGYSTAPFSSYFEKSNSMVVIRVNTVHIYRKNLLEGTNQLS